MLFSVKSQNIGALASDQSFGNTFQASRHFKAAVEF